MKRSPQRRFGRTLLPLVWLFFCGGVRAALAQGTAFAYQGRLTNAGNPANEDYDLQFALYDMPNVGDGTQAGPTLVRNPVAVSAGVFTVTLDFGADVFTGAARYLEIGVRPVGDGNPYTVLAPRQQITSTPYAIQTLNATQLGGLDASRYLKTDESGNVGIGAASTGATLFISTPTANATDNTATFSAPNIGPNGSHIHYGTTGDWYIRSASPLGKVVLQDTGGNVGIGTANPTSRLEIAAQDGLKIRGFQPFLTLTDTNTNRRSIFAGGNGDFGFYPDSFIGFSPAVLIKNNSGNVGIGVSDPTSKLEVASSGAGIKATSQGNAVIGYSSAPGFAAIYGENTSNAAGSGVYGRGTNGYAMYAEGNAGQSIDKGGWVKAMLFVLADGTIARCYNGLTGASTGNCGFSIVVTTGSLGGTPAILWYTVNTPFDVSNRFSSATSVGGGDNISVRIIGHGDTYVRVSPFWTHLSPSPVLNSEVPSDFFLIIF